MIRRRTMVSQVEDYLTQRRQAGFDLGIAGRQLLSFARFADGAHHVGPVTLALAIRWAQSARHGTPLTWARRFEVLRPFTKHVMQFADRPEIIPSRYFGPAHRRLAPHIYTDREIVDLLDAARRLAPSTGLRPLTYYTLFGLLAATGLRLSEALYLNAHDVERTLLTVRQTKLRKSRLVPLHATTAAALDRYADTRQRRFGHLAVERFFVSDRGTPLAARTVEWTFAGLRAQLGWVARGGHAFPRLHDMRHTYICRRLLRSYEAGRSIDHVVDILSTYVGHAKVSDTYWYVSATPELMTIAAKRFLPMARLRGAS
jgi:integrase